MKTNENRQTQFIFYMNACEKVHILDLIQI